MEHFAKQTQPNEKARQANHPYPYRSIEAMGLAAAAAMR